MSDVFVIEPKEVFYLGYPLSLSPNERAVLLALLRAERGLDTFELAAAADIPWGSAADAVRCLNRKAAQIGGREIVLSGKTGGYRMAAYL